MPIEHISVTPPDGGRPDRTGGQKAREDGAGLPQLSLRCYALAAVADKVPNLHEMDEEVPEKSFLRAYAKGADPDRKGWIHGFSNYLAQPGEYDVPLLRLATDLGLGQAELLATSLVAAAEDDLMVGRVLAYVQAPVGGSRPTLGLLAAAFESVMPNNEPSVSAMYGGVAFGCGLLRLSESRQPLAEREVEMPHHLQLALAGQDGHWPGGSIGADRKPEVPLPESVMKEAHSHARSLAVSTEKTMVVRCRSMAEGYAVAAETSRALGLRPLYITGDDMSGVTPWLYLRQLLPVFVYDLSPGERKVIPTPVRYSGPTLALCGPDGSLEANGSSVYSWTLTVPNAKERRQLWKISLGDKNLATDLATRQRHGSGRIAQLSRLARHFALLAGRSKPESADVTAAAWIGEGSGLEGLAQPITREVPDNALVMSPTLAEEMNALVLRCRMRDGLDHKLGASTTARYHPGVKALLVGPSGCGKTLAAGWLATKLGMPLYRVELSSVVSKYIGETEKNLAQLLARAEHSEVILLFDEADSLFGKRTDVQQANDRFANSQTNYLLQRIETYEGIAVMTSNSKSRFDQAFSRRLDMVVEFPVPSPQARRALWFSHLGDGHDVSPGDINRLAALADVTGGHIRNAVLTAAVTAKAEERPIEFADLAHGLQREYRKLGRQLPAELRRDLKSIATNKEGRD